MWRGERQRRLDADKSIACPGDAVARPFAVAITRQPDSESVAVTIKLQCERQRPAVGGRRSDWTLPVLDRSFAGLRMDCEDRRVLG